MSKENHSPIIFNKDDSVTLALFSRLSERGRLRIQAMVERLLLDEIANDVFNKLGRTTIEIEKAEEKLERIGK